MTRRHIAFTCERCELFGTLDTAPGKVGLLLVTGGNETRAGAFSGQAQFAARIAAAGYPVFRFDRRGVGDSEGINAGFRESLLDISSAIRCFQAQSPEIEAIVGFGNCDAASALMLARGADCDALVLANPWTIEQDDGTPPPAAMRARYGEKLRNPREWARLLTGRVNLRKLARGAIRAMRPASPPSSLAQEIAAGLSGFTGAATILLATRDRTAQAFEVAWDMKDTRIARCEGATHAFMEPYARDWLFDRVVEALKRIER